ncbi:hypothetical protein, partial [Chromobacterium violaceum]|uniref:hypothetical protein n=1 Tax=Chromobacterium violaceum TaxID=536 RepID=UPI001C39266E
MERSLSPARTVRPAIPRTVWMLGLDPLTKPLDAGYVCPHLAKMKRKVVSQKLWKSLQPLLPPSPR